MAMFEAITLGIVQGITGFLPVSSVGHLILTRTFFNITQTGSLAFEAFLYLAIALAVLVYFFSDVWQLTQAGLRKLGRLPVNKSDETLLYALLIASVPAVILGLSLESLITKLFASPLLIAGVLIAGSIFFMYAEWVYQHTPRANQITIIKGFRLGFFQALSLLPGMSLSGATIAGGMLLGLTRVEATRFTFLLFIPVIATAGLKKFISMIASGEVVAWVPVLFGAVTAFIVGFTAIYFMMWFIRNHSLWPFIWYRIILASFVIFITVLG